MSVGVDGFSVKSISSNSQMIVSLMAYLCTGFVLKDLKTGEKDTKQLPILR